MSKRRAVPVLAGAMIGLCGCHASEDVSTSAMTPGRTVHPSLVMVSRDALLAVPGDAEYERNDAPSPRAAVFSARQRVAIVRTYEHLRIRNGRPSESSLQTIRTYDRSTVR